MKPEDAQPQPEFEQVTLEEGEIPKTESTTDPAPLVTLFKNGEALQLADQGKKERKRKREKIKGFEDKTVQDLHSKLKEMGVNIPGMSRWPRDYLVLSLRWEERKQAAKEKRAAKKAKEKSE